MTMMNGKRRITILLFLAFAAATWGGLTLGLFYAKSRTEKGRKPPQTQEVIDFLSSPLPIPARAKQTSFNKLWYGTFGEGNIIWKRNVVLDATEMTQEDIVSIRDIYVEHFRKKFRLDYADTGNIEVLDKDEQEDFCLAMSGEETWHWRGKYSDDGHFDLEIDAQVMEFRQDRPGSDGWWRHRVPCLYEPVQGQRVIWIRFSFSGRNLAGPGKWPPQ